MTAHPTDLVRAVEIAILGLTAPKAAVAAIDAVRAYDAEQATRLQREDVQRAIDSLSAKPILHSDGSHCECAFGYEDDPGPLPRDPSTVRRYRLTPIEDGHAGAPRCPGRRFRPLATGESVGFREPCSLPLGHHGGCR